MRSRAADPLSDHQCSASKWLVQPLGDLAALITSGSRGWAQHYSSTGAIFLRIGNLTRDHIGLRLNDLQRVRPPTCAEGLRTRVMPDDVLISVTADLGIIGLVPASLGEAYVNQHIALVRLDKARINPAWVAHYLASKAGQDQFRRLNDAGAKAGLNLRNIADLRIPVPPRQEQDAIVQAIKCIDDRIAADAAALEQMTAVRAAFAEALIRGRLLTGAVAVEKSRYGATSA